MALKFIQIKQHNKKVFKKSIYVNGTTVRTKKNKLEFRFFWQETL